MLVLLGHSNDIDLRAVSDSADSSDSARETERLGADELGEPMEPAGETPVAADSLGTWPAGNAFHASPDKFICSSNTANQFVVFGIWGRGVDVVDAAPLQKKVTRILLNNFYTR